MWIFVLVSSFILYTSEASTNFTTTTTMESKRLQSGDLAGAAPCGTACRPGGPRSDAGPRGGGPTRRRPAWKTRTRVALKDALVRTRFVLIGEREIPAAQTTVVENNDCRLRDCGILR